MDRSVVLGGIWTPVLALLATLVGCLLTTHALVRSINTSRRPKRIAWLLISSWAIVTTAVWDMFFIAATGLPTEGLHIRYLLLANVTTIVIAVLATTGVLLLTLTRLSLVRILGSGAVLGFVMAISSFQALHAIRTNATVTFHLGVLIAVTVLAMLTTPVPLMVAVRSRGSGGLAGAAILLTLITAVTQYLNLYAVDFGQPSGGTAAGVLPTSAIIPVALSFVVRLLLLLVIMLPGSTAPVSRVLMPSRRSEGPR
jgi:NO-binding membrane sensor protein with MHYT domain